MTTSIRRNEWHYLDHAEIIDTDAPSVSVVIPARDCQPELDRLLASIAAQKYPSDAIEVIVVDDASAPPLEVPPGVTLLTMPPHDDFGAGRARNLGAANATGDILLFVDADLILGDRAIRRLAGWCSAHPAAVVTGVISFFDPSAIGTARLDEAIRDGEIATVLDGHTTDDQSWREKHFERNFDLTVDNPDLFRITIGAVMGVSRKFHVAVGGLRELGIRGIEDTEYGYRLHNAGGLFILDRNMELWHQGRRFFDSNRADQAKRDRERLNQELMAQPKFRPDGSKARQVPIAVVVKLAGVQVRGLESSSRKDLLIDDANGSAGETAELIDVNASPFILEFVADCEVSRDTVEQLIAVGFETSIGCLHLIGPRGEPVMTMTSRRAAGRAEMLGLTGEAASAHIRSAFGERSLPAADFGVFVV